jgi:hypothetical protein
MSVTAKLRTTLSLFLATFGVYSVSVEAHADSQFSPRTTTSETPRKTKKAEKVQEAEPPASPFAPGSQNLYLGVGQEFLLGSLGNNYDNSIGTELHYDYGVSDLFAFDSNFGYQSHSRNNTGVNIWNLAAGLRTNLAYFDQLVPYADVDLGFYHPSFSYASGGSASTLLFGMQLGLGIDLLLSKRMFFGAAFTYNDMFNSTKNDSNGNVQSLGGAYVSFMIHVGTTF